MPRLPEIGEFVRHHGRLLRTEVIPPPPTPPPETAYIFEDIGSRCEIRFNGEPFKLLNEYNDFYGLETSVKSAIKEMKEYAVTKNIGPDSDLEIVVIKIVSQFRAFPKNEENFYDKNFYDFDSRGSYLARKGLPEPVETVVWSSRDTTP